MMKYFFLLFFGIALQKANAQQVTIDLTNTDLARVVAVLQQQAPGYKFVFQQESLEKVRVPRVAIKSVSLQEALRRLQQEFGLTYLLDDHVISLRYVPKSSAGPGGPGLIKGQVTETNGSPLSGVTVQVKGTSNMVVSDNEGHFIIHSYDAGAVLIFTYTGYERKEVKVNGSTWLQVILSQRGRALEAVTVEARRKVNTENALLNERKQAAVVSDGISAQQMAKTASITTTQALARVTGVSITDDKYVAIRGMGDRSVIAELNGARLSSADPDRSAVPLDLVPAALLDNVTVYKTMTPDRPADATGGIIELKTKSIPDSLTLEVTVQTGYNSVVGLSGTFNSYSGANLGFWGQKVKPNDLSTDFLNLKNQYPGGLPQIQELFLQSRNSPALAAEAYRINGIMQSFPAVLTTSYQPAAPNQVYGISVGNNFDVFHGHQLGVIVSASYYSRTEDRYNAELNQYSIYQGIVTGSTSIFNPLTIPSFITPNDPRLGKYLGYTENTGITSLNYGVLTGLAYRFNSRNQVQFQWLGSRGAEARGANLNGSWQNTGLEFPVYNQVNQLVQTFRVFNTYNLQGEHKLLDRSWSPELSYNLSASKSSQDQPDFRFTDLADYRQVSYENPNGVGVVNDTYAFVVGSVQGVGPSGSIGADPNGRDYRFLTENNYNAKADLSLPFHVGGQRQLLKFGYNYLKRDRNYTESILGIPGSAAGGDLTALAASKGDLNELVSSANIGLKAPADYNQGGDPRVGGFLYQIRKSPNNYTGTYETEAAYAMADVRIGSRWRLTGGVRWEGTHIEAHVDTTNVFNPLLAEGTITGGAAASQLQSGTSQPNTAYTVNWKPYYSANLTYTWRHNMNFRLAYSTTLARPELRELTNIYEFDPFSFAVIAGNPTLVNQLAKSYDFRWEWFPNPGEVFSVSAFGKEIDHQLNKVFIYTPQGTTGVFPQFPLVEYQNDPNKGHLLGIEAEARKNLGLWWSGLKHFSIGTNFMWAYSEITKNPQRLDADRTIDRYASDKSPLFEQPPYSINAYVDYDNPRIGTDFTASFNIVGERLIQVQLDGSPDVYSRPVPGLDFVFSQHIWRRLNMKGFAKNLLDPYYRDVYATPGTGGLYHGVRYVQHQYKRGTEYMLGFTYDLF